MGTSVVTEEYIDTEVLTHRDVSGDGGVTGVYRYRSVDSWGCQW